MTNYKICLAQYSCIDGNKEANLKKVSEGIALAAQEKANIIVFPEMFLTGFCNRETMTSLAESKDGPSARVVRDFAARHSINAVLGFVEACGDGNLYNTTLVIDKNGQTINNYRKIHPFNIEKELFDTGSKWAVQEIDGILTGLNVCYDIEFPEAARMVGLRGARLIIVPSANMDPYDHRHRVFIMARAMENHAFLAYCNRVGKSTNGATRYIGESAVINPNGEVIAEMERDKEGLLFCYIDLDEVEKSKTVFNYLLERRPELYG